MKNVGWIFGALLVAVVMTGCGDRYYDGIDGRDGVDMGISLSAAPSCSAGGQTITSYVDVNHNAVLDAGDIVKQVGVICNGVDGTNGSNGTNGTNGQDGTSVSIAVASAEQCPTGGVVVQSGLVTASICNGAQGTMGPQGIQGLQGAQGPQGVAGIPGADGAQGIQGVPGVQGPVGPQGASGTVSGITPTPLCPGDTASFKEFGFVISGQLYAVYFDKTQQIAFMSQLSPGNYVTTDGGNCYFTYSNDGTNLKLTSSSATTTISAH